MEQLSFFPDSKPRTGLPYHQRAVVFFCVRLTELGSEAADVSRMLRRNHRLTGVSYDADRLHVSLIRVGDRDRLTEDDVLMLKDAAARVAVNPFPISFETVLSFDGQAGSNDRRAVACLVADGAAEIISLARDIEASIGRRQRLEG